jgi:hypothetical protein
MLRELAGLSEVRDQQYKASGPVFGGTAESAFLPSAIYKKNRQLEI